MLIVLVFSLALILPAYASELNDGALSADNMTADETISQNVIDGQESMMAASSSHDSEIAAPDEESFTALQEKIDNAPEGSTIDLDHNYQYDSGFTTDGITIEKDEITINGQGHTIDASGKGRIFNITGNYITITNLILVNGFSEENGGAIFSANYTTLINVTFTNNSANEGGAIYSANMIEIDECTFKGNHAVEYGADIRSTDAVTATNSTFTNSKSKYSPAIHAFKDLDSNMGHISVSIENCTFENLTAEVSGGAVGVRNLIMADIINCRFINTTAKRNGGALILDSFRYPGDVNIKNTSFISSCGDYGGALLILGCNLNMGNCSFTNNTALYDGGAIYASCCDIIINATAFCANRLVNDDSGNGGAMYIDFSTAYVLNCTITGNAKNGIYAYDTNLTAENTTFSKNGEAVHGVFLNYTPVNVNTGNDTLCLNDTNYFSIVSATGMELSLVNNTLNLTALPFRYDSRDWGWVTPVKRQGYAGYCWAFGTCAALETALLKATGIEYNISVNNMAKAMLKYSKYGITDKFEGGFDLQGMEYVLSWFGALPEQYDAYDELGKISSIILGENIHIVDAIIVAPRKNFTDNDALKWAILKCGAVTTSIEEGLYDGTNLYQNDTNDTSHQICLVGWDDHYSASNFATAPPGDGAFIIKNSMGTDFGENGYNYISYYDTSLMNITYAVGFLIGNTESYTRNYQYDLSGLIEIIEDNGNVISFKNTYTALGDELISAVGTYFSENEDYVLEVYVNDKLVHSQSGTAPFNGYHTVKLTKAISVSENDEFTVVMNKTSLTMFTQSRQHYMNAKSQYLSNCVWVNASDEGKVCCLKAYAVGDDTKIVNNDNVTVDYGSGECFSVKVTTSDGRITVGSNVKFTINGKTVTVKTDGDGIAKIPIAEVPGRYTITTVHNGKTYVNTVDVKLNFNTCRIVENKDISVVYGSDSYFSVKVVSADGKLAAAGAPVKFTINGKAKTVKADSRGIAKILITEVAGKYAVKTELGQKTYKNTVTVKKAKAKIFAKKKSYRAKAKAKRFTITLKDTKNKPIKNAKVTIKVIKIKKQSAKNAKSKKSKKPITAKTNKKGKATFKITANKKGKYLVKIKYKGDRCYTAASKKVKITMK